jgi:solute carrier family 25 folate transporter 32
MTYEFMKKHFALYVNTTDKISKEEGESSSNKNSRKGTTIGERLRDSLGYLTMGAISKFVASTATYPLQVIKSRLQQRSQSVEVSEITGEIVVMKREYSGLVDCTTKIWKNEGIYGFFKGCITNALRVAPSAAVTFVTYEFVMDMLTE